MVGIALLILLIFMGKARAITIELRYDYDTNNFFSTSERKAAMRAAADFYEKLIHDSLLPINPAIHGGSWTVSFFHPATLNQQTISNLVVPEDTLIVFCGGTTNLGTSLGAGGPGGYTSASGSQQWLDRVSARGNPGALANPKTDFGPWGGFVTFNGSAAVAWNFSTSASTAQSSTRDFIPVALHELGHLLGIGTAASWTVKVSGSNFTGAMAASSWGGPVPLHTDSTHWRNDGVCVFPNGHNPSNPNNVLNKAFGSFGTAHGFDQIALMDPALCTAGPRLKVMTDLDLAALIDIGWELSPPPAWLSVNTHPAQGVAFSWPGTTGTTYRVEWNDGLAGVWQTLTTRAGNGSILNFSAAAPAPDRAFFRLNTTPSAAPMAMPAATRMEPAPTSAAPQIVFGCTHSH